MGCDDPLHEASDIKRRAIWRNFFISDEKNSCPYRSGGLRINRISTQYFVIVINLLTTRFFWWFLFAMGGLSAADCNNILCDVVMLRHIWRARINRVRVICRWCCRTQG